MTGLPFARMHGCGNDFVVIDDRAGHWHRQREELAREICDRRRGLGGDGLILIERPKDGADFRMAYVNRTGMDGEMCGNGARCTVFRAAQLGLVASAAAMETDAGLIRADIAGNLITLHMTPPVDERPPEHIAIDDLTFDCRYIDTGVPHVVIFLGGAEQLDALDVDAVGRKLRFHPAFAPRGVNANFAARLEDGTLRMRTYERGVEMETLACGTGAVAVGLMAHRAFESKSPVIIHPTGGGRLEIGFAPDKGMYRNVTLTGPAETIAEGQISAGWLAERGFSAPATG